MSRNDDNFDRWANSIVLFQKSHDAKIHKDAIGEILKQVGSKRRYGQSLKVSGRELTNMLSIFENIPDQSCRTKEECKKLRQIGKKVRELSKKREFKQVVQLGHELSTSNIVSFLKLGDDFIDVKMEKFYSDHLPPAIFTPYILLEMMAIHPDYDWDRSDEIIRQSLVLAGMCFFDIYEHIHLLEEVLDYEDDQYQQAEKDELYYDAMEFLDSDEPEKALKIMKRALKFDPDYVQTYVGLVAAYREIGDFEKEKKYADLGFELTKKQFPKWPEEMLWGVMENRACMRSICDKATTSQIAGDTKTADVLYRLLLKMNPDDNQGIRYLAAGMYEGITPNDVDRMTDEGNKAQDWSAQENMVTKQNKIYKFWKAPKY